MVYWFIYEQEFMLYQYLLLKFPGFDGESYSNLILFKNIVNMIALLIFIPILSTKLHDSTILIIGLTLTSVGLVLSSFAKQLWQIYVAS